MLDHPNIARLYEAGTTREGRPYLAIELVPGLPLTMWCDQEGFGGDAKIDARADVYALGAVLYELVTGKTPLVASGSLPESHFELLRAVREVIPPVPSILNPLVTAELDGVVMKALAKDREERFGSVAEFDTALESPPRIQVVRFTRRWFLWSLFLPVAGLFWWERMPKPIAAIGGYFPPFTLFKRGYCEVETPEACIPPFVGATGFAWFHFMDGRGDDFIFAYSHVWRSSGNGEFILGAKSADRPGVIAVSMGSDADVVILEILAKSIDEEIPEDEREWIRDLAYDEIGDDDRKRRKKLFNDSLLTLERIRDWRRKYGPGWTRKN